ncbi:MAG: peroxidase-related enzyme [Candidatus Dormibacteraeota bacterium]|nr:peroxidase-related enzyme [Candidatus Dormibacteraeota bacterium]
MSEPRPISRFPIPDLADLPADLRDRIEQVAEKTGFVPNVFVALAWRPAELRAFLAYQDAVMESDSGLTKAERELIVVATSAANDCLYCVVAHGAVARIRTHDPLIADQVAVDYRKADLSPRQRAMLDFAVKLAQCPAEVAESDLESLRGHGFSENDIWDIGAVTALFALSNRLAHLAAMRPNPEFYLMGRVPRSAPAEAHQPA